MMWRSLSWTTATNCTYTPICRSFPVCLSIISKAFWPWVMTYRAWSTLCLEAVSSAYLQFEQCLYKTPFSEPETHGFLHYIDEDHTDFMALCEKVEQIVQVNWRGVHVYLKPVYKYYFGLFNKLIMPMVEKVWTENILPELGVSTWLSPSCNQ